MPDTQRQVKLPASLMAAIKATTADTTIPAAQRYEAALLITIGYGLWDVLPTYDPTSIAIPEDQWGEICNMLMNLATDDIGQVNMSLSWMNQGPSGYKP